MKRSYLLLTVPELPLELLELELLELELPELDDRVTEPDELDPAEELDRVAELLDDERLGVEVLRLELELDGRDVVRLEEELELELEEDLCTEDEDELVLGTLLTVPTELDCDDCPELETLPPESEPLTRRTGVVVPVPESDCLVTEAALLLGTILLSSPDLVMTAPAFSPDLPIAVVPDARVIVADGLYPSTTP